LHERPRDLTLRRRGGAAACALAFVIAIPVMAGCTAAPPADPAPTPVPSPSLTQEQQDDEAFRDVLDRYVDLNANTDTEEDLAQLLTGNVLDGEKSGLADARSRGISTSGKDVISGFQVTDRGIDPQGAQYMTAQLCLDVSGTRYTDSTGTDVTPQRDPRLSLQVKAVKSEEAFWRISDIVRNEDVHACD
jgi:predicted lipid-binding transport protein (Tim44 family)